MSNALSPDHYKNGGLETWDVIKAWMSPEAFKGYLGGNVMKYISRWEHKNGLEDLKKARVYLDKLIGEVEITVVEEPKENKTIDSCIRKHRWAFKDKLPVVRTIRRDPGDNTKFIAVLEDGETGELIDGTWSLDMRNNHQKGRYKFYDARTILPLDFGLEFRPLVDIYHYFTLEIVDNFVNNPGTTYLVCGKEEK